MLVSERITAPTDVETLHNDLDNATQLAEQDFGTAIHPWIVYPREPGTYVVDYLAETVCPFFGGTPETFRLQFEVTQEGDKCKVASNLNVPKADDEGIEYAVGFYTWPGLSAGSNYLGGTVLLVSPPLRFALVKPLPELDVPFGVSVSLDPNVEYCQPNGSMVEAYFDPKDPFYPESVDPVTKGQWGVRAINANVAWDQFHLGDPTSQRVLCIVDSGIFLDHEDFRGPGSTGLSRYLGGEDVTKVPSPDPIGGNVYPPLESDPTGHGTGVTGIATATISVTDLNAFGIAGVSNVKFRVMKVRDDTPQTSDTRYAYDEVHVAEGIRRCVDANPAEKVVISISLIVGEDHPPIYVSKSIYRAITHATQKGALIVAAAGNDPHHEVFYPASDSRVLSVGCSQMNITKEVPCPDTTHGDGLDLVAPGRLIWTTCKPALEQTACESIEACEAYDCYGLFGLTGGATSASAPFVSGAASWLWSYFPDRTAAQIRTYLECSADDLVPSRLMDGEGRLDLYGALLTAQTMGAQGGNCIYPCKAIVEDIVGVDKNDDGTFEGAVRVTLTILRGQMHTSYGTPTRTPKNRPRIRLPRAMTGPRTLRYYGLNTWEPAGSTRIPLRYTREIQRNAQC